jgi:hypothetical protein
LGFLKQFSKTPIFLATRQFSISEDFRWSSSPSVSRGSYTCTACRRKCRDHQLNEYFVFPQRLVSIRQAASQTAYSTNGSLLKQSVR